MQRLVCSLLFLWAISLLADVSVEEKGIRRVQAHLLIDDPGAALEEALSLSESYPDSQVVQKVLVEAFSANGQEEAALDLWNELTTKDPQLLYDRHLLEELSWGVLRKGVSSTQYGIRLASTIGAYLTHDVRAVPILLKMMRDSNAVIRSIAVQMAVSYRDAPLKDEIKRLLKEEKVWLVRLEVIKAVGALRIKELTSTLQGLVQSERTTIEEREMAIGALLEIFEEISLPELKTLARSNRAGLRHLACSIASHFELKEAKEEVIRLINDPHPAVRIAALNAFALVYRDKNPEVLTAALKDPDPTVAITAAWAAFLIDSSLGEASLGPWLEDSLPENRRMAASALATAGKRGVSLAIRTMEKSVDPYVKANLALGLLGQREAVKSCCDFLVNFLENEKRLWMMDARPNPLFQTLSPSRVRYNDQVPNYPEAQDQMTRLSLLSLLALVDDARALDAIKTFLKRKSWGISGFAATTLLHEGDETALDRVKELTQDPDPDVRLQASLVLAMFGKDESVLRDLQGAYAEADHEKKLHILEALARIGNVESFSFLASVLKEPFPILRVAAAAALVQSVNR